MSKKAKGDMEMHKMNIEGDDTKTSLLPKQSPNDDDKVEPEHEDESSESRDETKIPLLPMVKIQFPDEDKQVNPEHGEDELSQSPKLEVKTETVPEAGPTLPTEPDERTKDDPKAGPSHSLNGENQTISDDEIEDYYSDEEDQPETENKRESSRSSQTKSNVREIFDKIRSLLNDIREMGNSDATFIQRNCNKTCPTISCFKGRDNEVHQKCEETFPTILDFCQILRLVEISKFAKIFQPISNLKEVMHKLDAKGIEETNRSICTAMEDFMDGIEITDELQMNASEMESSMYETGMNRKAFRIKRMLKRRSIRAHCHQIRTYLNEIQMMNKPDAQLIRQSCCKIMSVLIGVKWSDSLSCVSALKSLFELMVMRELDANEIYETCNWIEICVSRMELQEDKEFVILRIESDTEINGEKLQENASGEKRTESSTEINGEKGGERIFPAVIDFIIKNAQEETVLSVFKDLICIEPNIKELYREKFDRSLLHGAVKNNHLIVAEHFLEYGVDPLSYDSSSKIPLSIAIDKRYDEMAALLVSKLPKFVVRRLFGDWESTAGPFENGQARSVLRGSSNDDKTYDTDMGDQMFTIRNLILKDLDKTCLQVLNSFADEQRNGLYTVHFKLLDNVDDVDIEKEPNLNGQTTFQAFVHHGKRDAIDHPVVRIYVNYHWEKWCQKKYLLNVCMYLFGLFCLTYSAVTGVTASDVRTYDTPSQYSRAVMEVISYLYALTVLFNEIWQMKRNKKNYFVRVFNYFELFSAILMIVVLPLRYINLRAHWYVLGVGYFLWAIRIFKYASVYSKTSFYAEVIKRVLTQDFVQFSILFFVINMIFSGTFLLMLKADDCLSTHNDTSSFQGILYVGVRTLIEAAPIVDYTGLDGYRVASTISMLLYMFFTIVVMLNILIAQLSDTYSKIHIEKKQIINTRRAWIIARAQENGWHPLSKKWSWSECYRDEIEDVDMKDIERNSSNLDDLSKTNEIIRKNQVKMEKNMDKLMGNLADVHMVKERIQSLEAKAEENMDKITENLKRLEHILLKGQVE